MSNLDVMVDAVEILIALGGFIGLIFASWVYRESWRDEQARQRLDVNGGMAWLSRERRARDLARVVLNSIVFIVGGVLVWIPEVDAGRPAIAMKTGYLLISIIIVVSTSVDVKFRRHRSVAQACKDGLR